MSYTTGKLAQYTHSTVGKHLYHSLLSTLMVGIQPLILWINTFKNMWQYYKIEWAVQSKETVYALLQC